MISQYDRIDSIEREREAQDIKARWEDLKLIEATLNLEAAQLREDRAYLRGEAAAYGILLD